MDGLAPDILPWADHGVQSGRTTTRRNSPRPDDAGLCMAAAGQRVSVGDPVLIAECGLDMSRWPTVGHFASRAGICPGNRQSAGRQRSGHTRPGPHWLREALTESAKAAARTKGTYLAAHHAQLRGRRGEAKATGATRHDILVAYYHIVRDQVPFRELGPDWQRRRYSPQRRAQRLQQQLEALGYKVVIKQHQEASQAA